MTQPHEALHLPARWRVLAVALMTLSALVFVPDVGGTAERPLASPSSRVVVRLTPGASLVSVVRGLRGAGAVDLAPVGALNRVAVRLPDGVDPAELGALPGVAAVEADPVVRATLVPDDTYWSHAWGMRTVDAPEAWETTTGSAEVVVAVLDTGVQASHPDLDGAVLAGRDVVNGDDDADDDQGHGTMAAGIVAARGDNGQGVAGACWRCRVLPVKVLDDEGVGTSSDAAAGLVWATDQGADIVSMSFGSPDRSSALADAVTYARNHGVVVIAAAGNEGTTTRMYPAALDGVVGVAGSDQQDDRYHWSNHGDWVDVAAPGCDATTLLDARYGEMCGTSAAAPVVAGIVGLVRSHVATASPDQVIRAVTTTGVSATYVAGGRVDADDALRSFGGTADGDADPTSDPEPTPTPEPTTEPEPSPSPTSEAPTEPEPSPSPTSTPDSDPVTEPIAEPTPETDSPPATACPASLATTGFDDVSTTSVHGPSIRCVVGWGVASGTSADTYTPGVEVTRGQMASFVARLIEATGGSLPPTGDRFSDDDGTVHEARIDQLAAAGLVSGVAADRYDPAATVSRAQMATFLVGAYEYLAETDLPVGRDAFGDDDGNLHEASIDTAAAAGLTSGVGDDRYRPEAAVRRDQMATFLSRLLQRLVEAEVAVPPTG